MKYALTIRDKCLVFKGIGQLPLSDIIIELDEYGHHVRADVFIDEYLYKHVGVPLPETGAPHPSSSV